MRKYLAELIGTFALVLVGAGTAAVGSEYLMMTDGAKLLPVALAHGLTVAVMIYAMGHISGIHINPAVTIAMRVCGKINDRDALGYIIAQLVGAAGAGFMLKTMVKSTGMGSSFLGATGLAGSLSPAAGMLYEGVGTFLFFLVIFGAAVDGRTAGNMAGLAIGLSLASLILVFGPLTGASFNPARTFGPALAANQWANWHVYLIGPIVGGTLAGLVQTRLFMKK